MYTVIYHRRVFYPDPGPDLCLYPHGHGLCPGLCPDPCPHGPGPCPHDPDLDLDPDPDLHHGLSLAFPVLSPALFLSPSPSHELFKEKEKRIFLIRI